MRVDVLTHIPEVVFADAWKRRVAARFAAVEVPVIGLDDLIANRRASGRTKDLADVEALERVRVGRPSTRTRRVTPKPHR